ncbi:MAG: hypothetical protein AAF636_08990 [Pseudomonadota bacterium]
MHRRSTALVMAIAGVFFFVIFISQDLSHDTGVEVSELPWGLLARYAVAMTLGGAFSGLLFAGLFGRHGLFGWILALVGGVFAVLLSGLFGSAFGLLPDLLADGFHTADLIATAVGIFVVPLTLFEQPYLLIVLVALVALSHVLSRRSRQTAA